MNCHHCAEPLEYLRGNPSHRCPDGHLSDRFGPNIAIEAAAGNMSLVTYQCGCTYDVVANPYALGDQLVLGILDWRCPEHWVFVIQVEPYTPNYPSDLPDNYWDEALAEGIRAIIQVHEETSQ